MPNRRYVISFAVLLTAGLLFFGSRRVAVQHTSTIQQPLPTSGQIPVRLETRQSNQIPVRLETSESNLDRLKRDALSEDIDAARAAFDELAAIGSEESLQYLISVTRTLGPGDKEDNAFASAQYLNRPEVTEFLVESFAKEDNDSAQRLIAELFRRSVTPDELQRLVNKYDNSELQKEVLAQLVGYLQEPRMVDAVSAVLNSSNEPFDELAVAAIKSLASTGEPNAVTALLRKSEGSRDDRLAEAIKSLSWDGAEVPLSGVALSADYDQYSRSLAITALGNYKTPDTCKTLQSLSGDISEFIAAAARSAYAVGCAQPQ